MIGKYEIYESENPLCVNCERIWSQYNIGESFCSYYRQAAFKIKVEAYNNNKVPITCFKYKPMRDNGENTSDIIDNN